MLTVSDRDLNFEHFRLTMDDAFSYLMNQRSQLPSRLYHFTSGFGALQSILKGKKMWASHAYDMNDNMELRYASNLVRLCLDEKRRLYTPLKIWQLDQFFDMAIERSNPYTNPYNELPEPFVISLCEDGTSKSQWEKYGNNGQGYCINFKADMARLKELISKNLHLIKVVYDVTIQTSMINTAIQKQVDYILANQNRPHAQLMGMEASIAFYQVMLFYTVAFKSKNWSDEQEWRLVRGVNAYTSPDILETRERGVEIVRYTSIDFADFAPCIHVADVSPGERTLPEETALLQPLVDAYRA